jgi:diacylglycerol kinase (ATP)
MNKPGLSGVRKLVASTHYSWLGLRAAWRNEEAFRLECMLAMGLVPLAFVIGEGLPHKLILVLPVVLVPLVELLNSALESVVDRVGTEQHPLSGQAKDLGSAAVFVTLVLFWLIWAPSLWHFLFNRPG